MVSFIIPVYNGEKYIKRSLKSIINNTDGDYEIIVVDDGSMDDTLKIVKKLQEEYCAIKIISQRNAGVSSARTVGVREASGEWIVFVDADDCIIADITEFIRVIQQNKKCDWIVFSRQFRESRIVDLKENNDKSRVITAVLNQNLEDELRMAKLNAVWSKAYRKDIIIKYNIQFEKELKHGEDMIFNLDYIEHCHQVYFCSESCYMLCANSSSVTHSYQKDCVKNDNEFLEQLRKRKIFANRNLTTCYYRMILNGIWICLGQYFSHRENKNRLDNRSKELSFFLDQEPYKTALKNYSVENNKRKRVIFMLLNLHCYKFVLKMLEVLRGSSQKEVMASVKI